RRDYRVGVDGVRSYYECPRCCRLIEDKPAGLPSVLARFEAPRASVPRRALRVSLTLHNASAHEPLSGALDVSISRGGLGRRAREPLRRFHLAPRATCRLEVAFEATDEAICPHIYNLRAIALANGLWHWRARPIMIAERYRPAPARLA